MFHDNNCRDRVKVAMAREPSWRDRRRGNSVKTDCRSTMSDCRFRRGGESGRRGPVARRSDGKIIKWSAGQEIGVTGISAVCK
jgi:hypothetical protein